MIRISTVLSAVEYQLPCLLPNSTLGKRTVKPQGQTRKWLQSGLERRPSRALVLFINFPSELAEKKAQQLKALTALAEDPVLVPSTYMMAHNYP